MIKKGSTMYVYAAHLRLTQLKGNDTNDLQLPMNLQTLFKSLLPPRSTINSKDLIPKREFTLESKIDIDGKDGKGGESRYGSVNYYGGH